MRLGWVMGGGRQAPVGVGALHSPSPDRLPYHYMCHTVPTSHGWVHMRNWNMREERASVGLWLHETPACPPPQLLNGTLTVQSVVDQGHSELHSVGSTGRPGA